MGIGAAEKICQRITFYKQYPPDHKIPSLTSYLLLVTYYLLLEFPVPQASRIRVAFHLQLHVDGGESFQGVAQGGGGGDEAFAGSFGAVFVKVEAVFVEAHAGGGGDGVGGEDRVIPAEGAEVGEPLPGPEQGVFGGAEGVLVDEIDGAVEGADDLPGVAEEHLDVGLPLLVASRPTEGFDDGAEPGEGVGVVEGREGGDQLPVQFGGVDAQPGRGVEALEVEEGRQGVVAQAEADVENDDLLPGLQEGEGGMDVLGEGFAQGAVAGGVVALAELLGVEGDAAVFGADGAFGRALGRIVEGYGDSWRFSELYFGN